MLAANKHGGEWDEGLLVEHLEAMDLTDLVLSGFSIDEKEDAQSRKKNVELSSKPKTVAERQAAAVLALKKLRDAAEEARNAALARRVAGYVKGLGGGD